MPCATAVKSHWSGTEIHWLTRSDMFSLVDSHPDVDKTLSFDRSDGIIGLLKLGFQLRASGYDCIYDAHNNQRSWILGFILRPLSILGLSSGLLRRSKQRWRQLLLLKFKKNTYKEWPHRNTMTYLRPLRRWGIDTELPEVRKFDLEKGSGSLTQLKGWEEAIVIVPSAAWDLKRWPLSHWQELVAENPKRRWVVLGGPKDDFCEEIAKSSPENVLNLAGKLSWTDSMKVVASASVVVGNDTGLTHLADYYGISSLFLIGAVPYGYPSRKSSVIVEKELSCKPCSKTGKDRCSNPVYKQCMQLITPKEVTAKLDLLTGRG